jgi:CubicO group peptidase (beta-lactamase class C family)
MPDGFTDSGFTDEGLAALDAALAGHVASGAGDNGAGDNTVPGLVALVARGGQVHVTCAGHKALGDGEPIGRDAIFRIASLTKPIVGAAAMLLIEDGAMALDDPVDRWLPELSDRRVLRRFDAELTDTVPAARAITVEDALSFRLGFGCVFAPGPLPIAQAEALLGLNTLGPPWPPTPLTPDEWIAGLGRLPLIDQPGETWRYNTGATVAGILVERVAGAPLAEVLSKRVFEPLGMADTGFFVPATKLGRFTSMYAPNGSGHGGGGDSGQTGSGHSGSGQTGLRLVDGPDGWYATPPALPDAAGWLVSTIDDLWAFVAMLAAGGAGSAAEGRAGGGRGLLSAESVRLMLRDRTSARDRAENPWFFGEHGGWGLMMSVPAAGSAPTDPTVAAADGMPRGYGWDGGSGTTWRTDPTTGLTGILLTQRMATSPEPPRLTTDFWSGAYAAIAK